MKSIKEDENNSYLRRNRSQHTKNDVYQRMIKECLFQKLIVILKKLTAKDLNSAKVMYAPNISKTVESKDGDFLMITDVRGDALDVYNDEPLEPRRINSTNICENDVNKFMHLVDEIEEMKTKDVVGMSSGEKIATDETDLKKESEKTLRCNIDHERTMNPKERFKLFQRYVDIERNAKKDGRGDCESDDGNSRGENEVQSTIEIENNAMNFKEKISSQKCKDARNGGDRLSEIVSEIISPTITIKRTNDHAEESYVISDDSDKLTIMHKNNAMKEQEKQIEARIELPTKREVKEDMASITGHVTDEVKYIIENKRNLGKRHLENQNLMGPVKSNEPGVICRTSSSHDSKSDAVHFIYEKRRIISDTKVSTSSAVPCPTSEKFEIQNGNIKSTTNPMDNMKYFQSIPKVANPSPRPNCNLNIYPVNPMAKTKDMAILNSVLSDSVMNQSRIEMDKEKFSGLSNYNKHKNVLQSGGSLKTIVQNWPKMYCTERVGDTKQDVKVSYREREPKVEEWQMPNSDPRYETISPPTWNINRTPRGHVRVMQHPMATDQPEAWKGLNHPQQEQFAAKRMMENNQRYIKIQPQGNDSCGFVTSIDPNSQQLESGSLPNVRSVPANMIYSEVDGKRCDSTASSSMELNSNGDLELQLYQCKKELWWLEQQAKKRAEEKNELMFIYQSKLNRMNELERNIGKNQSYDFGDPRFKTNPMKNCFSQKNLEVNKMMKNPAAYRNNCEPNVAQSHRPHKETVSLTFSGYQNLYSSDDYKKETNTRWLPKIQATINGARTQTENMMNYPINHPKIVTVPSQKHCQEMFNGVPKGYQTSVRKDQNYEMMKELRDGIQIMPENNILTKNYNVDEVRRNMQMLADRKEKAQIALSKMTCIMCPRKAEYICSNCEKTAYCSSICQASDWANHSNFCVMK